MKEKTYKYTPKTSKKMPIETYMSKTTLNATKWNKCSNEDTGWPNGYKNKTHTYAVYKRPTLDLETHRDGK